MSKLTGLEQDVLDLEAEYDAMDISPEHRCRLSVDRLVNECINRSIRCVNPSLANASLYEALAATRAEIARLRLISDSARRSAK